MSRSTAAMDKRDLANWIVRLSAKGEALKAGRGSPGQQGDGLRRVALVTCAKSVAEVQLFRQQSAAAALAARSRSRSGSTSGTSNGGCGDRFSAGGGGGGGERRQRLKRLHSTSFSSDSLSSVSGSSSGPDGTVSGSSGGSSCNCDSCSLCSKYQAAGANSCYCRAIGYAGPACSTSSGNPAGSAAANSPHLSDDEESKLIDEFLTSLDGVPSNKKCKRL